MNPAIRRGKTVFTAAAALLICIFFAPGAQAASPSDAAKSIAIQHGGRVKSFDTFCREWMQTVAGKPAWERRPAIEAVMEALAREGTVYQNRWIRVGYRPLADELGLPKDRTLFSYEELRPGMDKIEALLKSSSEKRDRDVRPSKSEQENELVYARLQAVHSLETGEAVLVIPPGEGSQAWGTPYQTLDPRAKDFKRLVELFADKKYSEFRQAAESWVRETDRATGSRYARGISMEKLYYAVRPFQAAWIIYLSCFLLLSLGGKKAFFRTAGLAAFVLGFAFHSLGLGLRVVILERPPVSNMYESMVYMNWALVVFALGLWAFFRHRSLLSVGAAVSAMVMVYADLLPIDSGMSVLVPVLRSNYWLTIHVMTIVSSYGAFGLAMGLGHRHLVLFLSGKLKAGEENQSANLIYQTIQVGTLLLGAGTILGGVWANESWGRFWGWDPKETWALITFLAYLVIVHLKFSKMIDHFWMAMSSILGFLFVLMTWYGVNFVLGRGLHSYGQGSGGIVWIVYFLAAEALFITWVYWKTGRKFAASKPR